MAAALAGEEVDVTLSLTLRYTDSPGPRALTRWTAAPKSQTRRLIAMIMGALPLLLVFLSPAAHAQTMPDVKFVKLVRDPANQNVLDLALVLDLKNNKHAPITATKDQFVVLDNKGDIYQASDGAVPSGIIPAALGAWAELPQRINPRVTVSPALFFVVPSEFALADARVCLGDDCIALGPAAAALDEKEMELYKSQVAAALLMHWDEPSDLPPGPTTHLRAIIQSHGEVDSVAITMTSGYPRFDQSCLDSALQVHKLDPPPIRTSVALYFYCSVGASHPYPFGVDDGLTASLPYNGDDAIDGIPLEKAGLDVQPPKLVFSIDPKMPADFPRNKGFQAEVVVTLIVDSQGAPQKVEIARSYNDELNHSAVEAVKQYRFKPAMRKGMPVPVRVNVDVTFHSR